MDINNAADLELAITQLQEESDQKKIILRNHFNGLIESMKPVNLLKSTVKDIAESPGIATAAIGTSLAIGAGVMSKKMIIGSSTNIFKRMLGGLVEFMVAKGIANNSEALADKGIALLKKLAK